MVLTIYNASPPLLFICHEVDSTAKKTHLRVTTDPGANMKMRNVETITHNFL